MLWVKRYCIKMKTSYIKRVDLYIPDITDDCFALVGGRFEETNFYVYNTIYY